MNYGWLIIKIVVCASMRGSFSRYNVFLREVHMHFVFKGKVEYLLTCRLSDLDFIHKTYKV